MKYLRIIQTECQVSGGMGWAIKGADIDHHDFAASFPDDMRLIAHDIVEHPSLVNIGSVEDELEALGGAWNTRGKWGDSVTDEGIAGDVGNMFSQCPAGELKKAPKTRGFYDEDLFKMIIKLAKKYAKDMCGYTKQAWKKFKKQALRWMGLGYVKSVKRFGDRFVSNNLFNSIKEELERVVQYAMPYEEVSLGYSFKNGRVKVRARIFNPYENEY